MLRIPESSPPLFLRGTASALLLSPTPFINWEKNSECREVFSADDCADPLSTTAQQNPCDALTFL